MSLKLFQLGVICMLVLIICINEANSMNSTTNECHLQTECGKCVKNSTCLWCYSSNKCLVYPVNHVLPTSSDCPLASARWGVCWLNFEALIISLSVIGGLLLVGITLCICKCCGCCCFSRNDAKYQAEVLRLERERENRAMRQDQRKQERQRRNDDIRRKYGLITRDTGRYQRFEDDETA